MRAWVLFALVSIGCGKISQRDFGSDVIDAQDCSIDLDCVAVPATECTCAVVVNRQSAQRIADEATRVECPEPTHRIQSGTPTCLNRSVCVLAVN